MRKIAWLLAVLLAFSSPSALAEAVQAAGPVEETAQDELAGYVIILHTGRTLGEAGANMGFERVAEAKRRFEAEGASVLILDAGDAFVAPAKAQRPEDASPEETAQPEDTDDGQTETEVAPVDEANEAVLKAMNAAGYDAMTPGESEFQLGLEALMALRGMAGFPMLSVNAQNEEGARLLSGSIIVEKDGLRIGVFGLTGGVEAEGVTLADAAESAQAAVETLRGEGCDLVIALAHLGKNEEGRAVARDVAEQVEHLDAVIDITAGAPASGQWLRNGVLIASAPEKLAGIGVVAIDPTGRCAAMNMDESWF